MENTKKYEIKFILYLCSRMAQSYQRTFASADDARSYIDFIVTNFVIGRGYVVRYGVISARVGNVPYWVRIEADNT